MLSQAALSLVGGGISPCGYLCFLHIGDGSQLLDESAYLCLFFMQQVRTYVLLSCDKCPPMIFHQEQPYYICKIIRIRVAGMSDFIFYLHLVS